MNGGAEILHGSCLCGGVRFEVTDPFLIVSACHCAFCKKLSGGYGTVSGGARTASIRILEGAELLTRFTPEGGSAKTFCSVCGSNLFGGGWPERERASVRLSAIDTPFDRKIEAHGFVDSVAPWEDLPDDGLPRHEGRIPPP
jgi:hypothetical protein